MLARLTAALIVLAVPSSAAAAPALTPLRPCYVAVSPTKGGTEKVELSGTGFTPNALVDVAVDGEVRYPGVRIDATGALPAGTLSAPFVESGRRAFAVTVTEQLSTAQTATVTALTTRLTVEVEPAEARPSSRVRFSGSGFMGDAPVYAHYLRKGKVRRTVRLVKETQGACGDFSVRRRQFPFSPSTGRWILQVDQVRRYTPKPVTAFLQLRVDVRLGG